MEMPARCSEHRVDETETILGRAARECGAIAATLHERSGDILILRQQVGIPQKTLDMIRSIPKGKGMAGQAWVTGKAVSTCNLKSDPNQVIQPGARSVKGLTATAIPVHTDSGQLSHVVGFSFADQRQTDGEPGRLLERLAVSVAIAASELS